MFLGIISISNFLFCYSCVIYRLEFDSHEKSSTRTFSRRISTMLWCCLFQNCLSRRPIWCDVQWTIILFVYFYSICIYHHFVDGGQFNLCTVKLTRGSRSLIDYMLMMLLLSLLCWMRSSTILELFFRYTIRRRCFKLNYRSHVMCML